MEILTDLLPGYDATAIENLIETEIVPQMDLRGTKISYAGEREDIKENFTALAVLTVAAIFFIYILCLSCSNFYPAPGYTHHCSAIADWLGVRLEYL